MIRYVALLRGINVGGNRLIKMEALRQIFTNSGLGRVSTYIQSGNVLFESPETNADALTSFIENRLLESLGYAVTVVLRTSSALSNTILHTPFNGIMVDKTRQIYVSFLSAVPDPNRQKAFLEYQNEWETFLFHQRDLYSLIRKDSPQKINFSNTFAEKKLGVLATTRNWATVQQLDELLRQ